MARTSGSSALTTAPRIRDAALRLFARHGFAAVSMRQIAADVGVQVGALYLYTPDKESLLFDLLETHMTALIAAWEAEDRPAAPVDALCHFVRFHIRRNRAHPDAVFLSYMELRNLGPAHFQRIDALRRAYEDRLGAIIAQGTVQGRFRPADARIATMAIIALLNGVNTWFRSGGRLPLDQVEALYADMALAILHATPGDGEALPPSGAPAHGPFSAPDG